MSRPTRLTRSFRSTRWVSLLVLMAALPIQADQKEQDPAPTAAQQAEAAKAAEKKAAEQELRKRIRDLERELNAARADLAAFNTAREKERAQAAKSFDFSAITLPENPTRAQCEAYVAQLREACADQVISDSHPAIAKLKQLPTEHYDLLVIEMGKESRLRAVANYVMKESDPELLRKGYVDNLKQRPWNLHQIVVNGWCEDVRPAIISHATRSQGFIEQTWFQAAVEINEPSLYPKLHEVTIQSRYAGRYLTMLAALPDYDLDHTVKACWQRVRAGKLNISAESFAGTAAAFGSVEALGVLIDTKLKDSSSYLSWSVAQYTDRAQVLRLIDQRGSNQQIRRWFQANKDQLVYDSFRKRFVVSEDF